MRAFVIGLVAVLVLNGCASLRKTEELPSPAPQDSLEGPEGEEDPGAL
jgi:hypothetical protein